ncbi:MAG: branched-chain amino acid ABC transporter permease [Nitrososphaerales archaeon]
MLFDWLLGSVLRSILIGSLYTLMALGLTLTLSVVRLPNFAHAELITIGAYVAVLSSLISGDISLALILAFIITSLVAFSCHRVVYRPLSNRGATMYTLVLASFALGLVLRYIILLWASPTGYLQVRPLIPQQVVGLIGTTVILNVFLWSLPTAFILVLLLHLLLSRTKIGKMMRSVANNITLAQITGINVGKIQDISWLLAGGLAGVAGALWAILYYASPYVGWFALLSVFAAVVLGGLTSFSGTIAGGFIVGLSENLVMDVLNRSFGVEFTYKPVIPFAIIILVLLVRPKGLVGLLSKTRIVSRVPSRVEV